MRIDPGAQSIYKNYTSRTASAASDADKYKINIYIRGIFDSAVSPYGNLSDENAAAVEQFFRKSGLDLDQIDLNEAKTLYEKWSATVKDYLPAIRYSEEISLGFAQLMETLNGLKGEYSGPRSDVAILKMAVFFNRIIEGSKELSPENVELIRRNIDQIGEFVNNNRRQIVYLTTETKIGEFCMVLLRATAKTRDEGRALCEAFTQKYFRFNTYLRQMASCP